MKFNVLTNKKPAKNLGEELIAVTGAAPGFKLTAKAAEKLGVTVGDYVTIVTDPSDSSVAYVAKGYSGVGEAGEEGYEAPVGGKVAAAGSNFSFSSANAFQALGDENLHVHYDIADEAEDGEFEWSDSPVPCYKLTRKGTSEPIKRGKKSDSTTTADSNDTEMPQADASQAMESADMLSDNALDEL